MHDGVRNLEAPTVVLNMFCIFTIQSSCER